MRLSELIHKPVIDNEGVHLGFVQDLRVEQEGPVLGTWGAAFRASSLIVVPHKWLSQLGWDVDHTHGPWLLKAIAGRFNQGAFSVPWRAVARCDGPVVELNISRSVAIASEVGKGSRN